MATVFNYRVLRPWRLESGLKPERVCVEADISYPYLLQLEAYGGNPSAAVLARLAAVYGHDLAELFTSDEPASAR
jgi:transcriptional regulator with XRE-family HTH domain